MRLSRRIIIQEYLSVQKDTRMNPVRTVAKKLGYTLDQNNSNSHVAEVIRTFKEATKDMH